MSLKTKPGKKTKKTSVRITDNAGESSKSSSNSDTAEYLINKFGLTEESRNKTLSLCATFEGIQRLKTILEFLRHDHTEIPLVFNKNGLKISRKNNEDTVFVNYELSSDEILDFYIEENTKKVILPINLITFSNKIKKIKESGSITIIKFSRDNYFYLHYTSERNNNGEIINLEDNVDEERFKVITDGHFLETKIPFKNFINACERMSNLKTPKISKFSVCNDGFQISTTNENSSRKSSYTRWNRANENSTYFNTEIDLDVLKSLKNIKHFKNCAVIKIESAEDGLVRMSFNSGSAKITIYCIERGSSESAV